MLSRTKQSSPRPPACDEMRVRGRASHIALGLSILIGYLIAVGSLSEKSATAGLPPLTLDKTVVAPGAVITIEGSRWPAPRQLQAAVCGAGPQSVSSDCDLARAISFGPSDNGVFRALLTVAVPPVPCPCVVMVTQVNPSDVERLPITIEGAVSAPVPAPPPTARPAVSISDVHVVSDSSWSSWFGAAAARELVVTVHNQSLSTVRPLLVAGWTEGSDDYVVTSPTPKVLGAGRSAQITAAFDLSTFASGQFLVSGKVTGAGFQTRFVASTATTPWALYLLGMLIAVGVLLTVAALIGRRSNGTDLDENEPTQFNDDGDDLTAPSSKVGVLQ